MTMPIPDTFEPTNRREQPQLIDLPADIYRLIDRPAARAALEAATRYPVIPVRNGSGNEPAFHDGAPVRRITWPDLILVGMLLLAWIGLLVGLGIVNRREGLAVACAASAGPRIHGRTPFDLQPCRIPLRDGPSIG